MIDADHFKAAKILRSEERRARREQAFSGRERWLAANGNDLGLVFVVHSESHYSVSVEGGWRINIYPGNRRIHRDRNRKRSPWFDVPTEWTLDGVREAVIAARKGQVERGARKEFAGGG